MLWFKHFTEAGQDLKLVRLKHQFGMEGYGTYWTILEMLAKETKAGVNGYETYCLNLSTYPVDFLATKFNINPERFKSMLDLMVETELFDVEPYKSQILSCSKLAKIADDYTLRRVRTVYGQRPKSVRKVFGISSASYAASAPHQNVSNSISIIDTVSSEIVTAWNNSGLPCIKKLSAGRRAKLKERWKSEHFRESWKQALEKISKSTFAKGSNNMGWKASIDWFLNNDTNYLKALEGKYDDKSEDRFAKY